jgi:hypothetical protein
MRYMGAPEPGSSDLKVKLKSPFWGEGSSAGACILADGGLQLDLYDFSDAAQSSMGNDVAWYWRVAPEHKPRLIQLLEQRTGAPIPDDQALLNALAQNFEHVHAVRDWLKANSIPFEEVFDSWA